MVSQKVTRRAIAKSWIILKTFHLLGILCGHLADEKKQNRVCDICLNRCHSVCFCQRGRYGEQQISMRGRRLPPSQAALSALQAMTALRYRFFALNRHKNNIREHGCTLTQTKTLIPNHCHCVQYVEGSSCLCLGTPFIRTKLWTVCVCCMPSAAPARLLCRVVAHPRS